jgi:hypothetical protein
MDGLALWERHQGINQKPGVSPVVVWGGPHWNDGVWNGKWIWYVRIRGSIPKMALLFIFQEYGGWTTDFLQRPSHPKQSDVYIRVKISATD